MRALAYGLRTTHAYSMPARRMSPAYCSSPVTLPTASSRRRSPPPTRRLHHGREDLRVACAAAQSTLQGAFHLARGGGGVSVEQRLGRHDHPGSAVPALDGSQVQEGLLNRVQPPGSLESLDRLHLLARNLGHLPATGTDGAPAEGDRARPALTFIVAALLGSGRTQVVAQHVQQGSAPPGGEGPPGPR